MSLCKSGQIGNCCLPNALLTLQEYLEDYAAPETKRIGEKMIRRQMEEIGSDKVRAVTKERLELTKRGQRDFYSREQ